MLKKLLSRGAGRTSYIGSGLDTCHEVLCYVRPPGVVPLNNHFCSKAQPPPSAKSCVKAAGLTTFVFFRRSQANSGPAIRASQFCALLAARCAALLQEKMQLQPFGARTRRPIPSTRPQQAKREDGHRLRMYPCRAWRQGLGKWQTWGGRKPVKRAKLRKQ